MRVHILDDWFDTLRHLPSFRRLEGHEVTVWTDHLTDPAALAARMRDAEVLVLFRERTRVTEELVAGLPKLRLVSQRSAFPHVDVPALTRRGILLSSDQHSDTPSVAAAELTFNAVFVRQHGLELAVRPGKAHAWREGI